MTATENESGVLPASSTGLETARARGTVLAHEQGLSWDDPRWLVDPAELEARCRTYLEGLRWPEGVDCPRCHSHQIGELPARRKFYCRSCRYHFSVTAGTVFHNSHLPLWKWFLTVSEMLSSESGIPANQLAQLLGGSYKTAWFVQHRVRVAMREAGASQDRDVDGETERARSVREAVVGRQEERETRTARLFARPLVGPYHQLSVKHAYAYVAEMEWRATCRHKPSAFRETVASLLNCDPVAFDELTAEPRPTPEEQAVRRSKIDLAGVAHG